jgi:hypothetical protein
MTKGKKTKARQRGSELDRIAAKLRTVLRRETSDVVLAGQLLIESRKHLEHGEWQDWLAENFDLSYRTALRYVSATEYVDRQKCHVSLFANLAPTVLYRLADGGFTEQEEAEILAQAKAGKRIDHDRAWGICERLAPPPTDSDDDVDDDDDDTGESVTAEDPDIAAILDGPPPAVPPPAQIAAPPDYAVRTFDQAVTALKQLMTKPAAQFVSTIHRADDLENVEGFIRAVADRARKGALANTKPPA